MNVAENQVVVYGASDDLIEVDGAVTEEFYTRELQGGSGESDGRVLAFSDGTVLEIVYGAGSEGFWRIRRLATGKAKYELVEADDEQTNYSDRVTLTGDIKWVVAGDAFVRGKKREAVES
jgi:hypothetical protein